jgi:hypothetical protein
MQSQSVDPFGGEIFSSSQIVTGRLPHVKLEMVIQPSSGLMCGTWSLWKRSIQDYFPLQKINCYLSILLWAYLALMMLFTHLCPLKPIMN